MNSKITKPYQLVEATIQIPKEALQQTLAETLSGKGVKDTSKMESLTTTLAEYLLSTFAPYEVEYFIDQQIGSGNLTRKGEILGDIVWDKKYTLSQLNNTWRDKNKEKLYRQYIHFDSFGENNDPKDKELQRKFSYWVKEAQVDEEVQVSCTFAQRSFFPIELMQSMERDASDLHPFAFSVVEIEKLIKEKRLHKYKEERPLGFAPANVFFIKWIDGKIRFLQITYSETNKEWNYIVKPLKFTGEGTCRAIAEKSKIFMKDVLFSQ